MNAKTVKTPRAAKAPKAVKHLSAYGESAWCCGYDYPVEDKVTRNRDLANCAACIAKATHEVHAVHGRSKVACGSRKFGFTSQAPGLVTCPECKKHVAQVLGMALGQAEVDWRPAVTMAEDHYAV